MLKKWKTALSISLAAFAVLGIFTLYQRDRIKEYERQLHNNYNRSFYEMVGYVNNLEPLLVKVMVTATPEKTTNFLEEIWRSAAMAQTILTELPISENILGDMSKFLIQVGDYTYTLSQQSAGGTPISDEQYQNLESMQVYAQTLNESLKSVMTDFSEGTLSWNVLAKVGEEVDDLSVTNLIKTFADYPTLIYDGPYSDHIPEIAPKGISGSEISAEDAKKKAEEFFKNQNVTSIEQYDESLDSAVTVYRFSVSFENKAESGYIDITKTGGHYFWALKNREIGASLLSVDDAKAKSLDFLEKIGFKDMKDSYFTKENGVATLNYVYNANDVKYYPDMVKVKVALDTGEIMGYEAKGYLYSHADRGPVSTKLSLEEATALVSPHAEISSASYAVIPTEFKTEVLTYEFIGKLNDKDLLIYINADTGHEEEVLIILDTDQGILTQ